MKKYFEIEFPIFGVYLPINAYDISNNLKSSQIDFSIKMTPIVNTFSSVPTKFNLKGISMRDAVILEDYYNNDFQIIEDNLNSINIMKSKNIDIKNGYKLVIIKMINNG